MDQIATEAIVECEDVDKFNFLNVVAFALVQGREIALKESIASHTSYEQLLGIWLLKAVGPKGD